MKISLISIAILIYVWVAGAIATAIYIYRKKRTPESTRDYLATAIYFLSVSIVGVIFFAVAYSHVCNQIWYFVYFDWLIPYLRYCGYGWIAFLFVGVAIYREELKGRVPEIMRTIGLIICMVGLLLCSISVISWFGMWAAEIRCGF